MSSEGGGESGGGGKRQAPWHQPLAPHGQGTGLRILNSLTREKELFVPRSGRHVDWYICGPTVYDSAHAGHARAYVCFDVLRRVLRDYFGYRVRYVMNITDIDDKIIARARKRHLFTAYLARGLSPKALAADAAVALTAFRDKAGKETNEDKKKLFATQLFRLEASLKTLDAALASGTDLEPAKEKVIEDGRDALSDWLDAGEGENVTDQAIFASLARHFEAEFHQDMASLGVEPADVVTRVSEYVPEIVDFIQKIIDKGFAYEANGSVYFDTNAFNSDPKHFYAKLLPEGFGDEAALAEGEGDLFSKSGGGQSEKRSACDFALWKRSKGGEPRWESPWGLGRPGWHIECSVMASAICGEHLDIHSGGSDLRFPHHDNEIAQSEAAFGISQWANYWLHAGTLRIEGSKMSKSLKNFISIRKALEDYTPRQLRILFLLHGWADTLDFSTNTLGAAIGFEKSVNEFFLVVKHYLRQHFDPTKASAFVKFQAAELELSGKFAEIQTRFHDALCDNIDTKTAMSALKELISESNQYIQAREAGKVVPNSLLLRNIARFVTQSLRMFGAVDGGQEVGFGEASGETGAASKEDLLMPYLNALVDFREEVRTVALGAPKEHLAILKACDVIRNETLPGLGVRLEDKETGTVVKLVSADELRREAAQRQELEEKKRAEKERREADKAAKEAKLRIPASELFQGEIDEVTGKAKYTAFDENGLPTHNAAGEELGKGLRKKLAKIQEAHAKKQSQLATNGTS